MTKSELNLQMEDGQNIHLYLWKPDEGMDLKGIVQIAHGAGEHGKRYEHFASFLTENGYLVCADDHRGHGLSAKDKTDLGFFGDEDGWRKVVEDLFAVTKYLKNEYRGLDLYLLGHSMGSFLARTYAILHGEELKGLILSGTAHNPKPLLLFGSYMAGRDVRSGRARALNPTLNKMAFKDLNKSFRGGKTGYEWISRDPETVKKYVDDEFCGFEFTSSAFRDMFGGLLFITDRKNIGKTPKELPILLLAGTDDPVGGKGKMVQKCRAEYARSGVKNLEIKLYEGMRHEILNEIGKEEVYDDVLRWLLKMKGASF